jgi:transcription termination/antitermination protein NusA
MTIKFDMQTLQTIAVFEKTTKARVKDCFEDGQKLLTFIVETGDLIKAIGKGAQTILRLKKMLNRNIRVIEFNPSVIEFIKNVARPAVLVGVQDAGNGVYVMQVGDLKTRGYLIGRQAQTLRNNEAIAQRYYPIKELKVELLEGVQSQQPTTESQMPQTE